MIALYRIARLPDRSRTRRAVLWLEGISWALFAIFSLLYFGLKSPILGAVDTLAGLLATGASVWFSVRLDFRATLLLQPRLLWLLLATYVSAYVALANADPLLGLGPWLIP
ncbi:MAG: hypothetical protein OHK0039_00930 [Bacteroidia bacterium]